MDALELIHERYRFTRSISATKLRRELKREKGQCTWCGGPASAGMRHCSDTCRQEVYVRAGLSTGGVAARDKGICSICGLNTIYVQSLLWQNRERFSDFDAEPDRIHRWRTHTQLPRLIDLPATGTPYEIDHVIPVCEGGGCCGTDNLRTLCRPCHKAETKRLRTRRSSS